MNDKLLEDHGKAKGIIRKLASDPNVSVESHKTKPETKSKDQWTMPTENLKVFHTEKFSGMAYLR